MSSYSRDTTLAFTASRLTIATFLATGLPYETQRTAKQQSKPLRRHRYTKVLDNRKHLIRGLWRRNRKFLAGISVEAGAGRKEVRWVPLAAKSTAEAQEEFRKLHGRAHGEQRAVNIA